jgi:hypothetical protein
MNLESRIEKLERQNHIGTSGGECTDNVAHSVLQFEEEDEHGEMVVTQPANVSTCRVCGGEQRVTRLQLVYTRAAAIKNAAINNEVTI